MQKITPFLWLDHQAEEVAKFYTSLFPNSSIGDIARYDAASAEVSGQKEGTVMVVSFTLNGYRLSALNGGPIFTINPSISFSVGYETDEEIDTLWNALIDGGKVLMELGAYPFSEKYGWLQDKYGVSWQIIKAKLPQAIIPGLLFVKENYGKAKEAMQLYTSLFPNSKITSEYPYGPEMSSEKPDALAHATFTLNGEEFIAMDSGMDHQFTFSEGVSLEVTCETQDEIDHYWNGLIANGGQESQCGWLKDPFGVSWQINARILNEMLLDPDTKKAGNAMRAMLTMKKLDIAQLQEAFSKD